MPKVRDIGTVAEKWNQNTQAATANYEAGIKAPRNSWKEATVRAEANYKAGVQAAAAAGSFAKGVSKAGDAAWQEGAVNKGAARFGQGVAFGKQSYQEGFAPFRAVIEATTLPERRPKGDPANLQRVAVMSAAMRQAKVNRK